ncbi:MAG TPA: hypothetical protein VF278_21895 [Pirellulales bacterium]
MADVDKAIQREVCYEIFVHLGIRFGGSLVDGDNVTRAVGDGGELPHG